MADPFTLQAHITDACDLQCHHCYRDERRQELDLPTWQRVLDDFTAFCQQRRIEGRVTFAGGEPLLRFTDLVTLTRQATTSGHQVHLLTNGLRLTLVWAQELKAAGCLRVQVSIDGERAAHEAIRGKDTYEAALAGLEHAATAGLARTISMTVDQTNARSVPAVAGIAAQYGAKLFVSRLVPCGRGAARAEQLLPASQWLAIMRLCLRQARKTGGNVALRDPLYGRFQGHATECSEGGVSGCACGYAGLAVEADGEAYPCRRLPVSLGNLKKVGLEEIWRSPVLEQLRDRDALGGTCGTCGWRSRCGGCRAVAWATTGSYLATDPQCPWAQSGWQNVMALGLRCLRVG
ncbi:MAG: radical SAM protein [Phycisphaerae bacterium]